MKIKVETEQKAYEELKDFYIKKIKEACSKYGYCALSLKLGHDPNFITVVKKREAFEALRRLYKDLKNKGYIK